MLKTLAPFSIVLVQKIGEIAYKSMRFQKNVLVWIDEKDTKAPSVHNYSVHFGHGIVL